MSQWIFRVTACQLREPRTLWHNTWSGYHCQNLQRQFLLSNHNEENVLLSNCCSVDVFHIVEYFGFSIHPLYSMMFPRFNLFRELRTKKALLFPAKRCRFQQGFVVSGEALLFPTRLCCFQQGFDVSWITFARMSKTLCIYVEQ